MRQASGFTGIEVVVALALIALVGSGAWLINQSSPNKPSSPSVLSENSGSNSGSGSSSSSGSSHDDDDAPDDSSGSSSGNSGSGSSGSSGSGSPTTTTVSPTPSPFPTVKVSDDDDSPEDEDLSDDSDIKNQTASDDTTTKPEGETQSRITQFLADGSRQRIEWRLKDGKYELRVKTISPDGTETDERLELKPGEERSRFSVENNGVEQQISLRVRNNKLTIEQSASSTLPSAQALTALPVVFDEELKSLQVTTSTGTTIVKHFPAEVAQKILDDDSVDLIGDIELGEDDQSNQAVYTVAGVKQLKLLNLLSIDAPINVTINPTTLEQIELEQPWYLRFFGILFTS